MSRFVIGIDPGPVPGIVVLWPDASAVDAVQCNHQLAPMIVGALIHACQPSVIVAVERFVVGRASMRSSRDGEITRDLIGNLQRIVAEHDHASLVMRSAAEIKPWATDDRLAHAGLLEPTKAMRHARDAARHALFAAVKDGGLPDPLSRKARP